MDENIKNRVAVSREQAEIEVDRWLYEVKRIRQRIIEEDTDLQSSREKLINNMIDGIISIDEEGYIELQLMFPENIGNQKSLRFKPRMKMEDQRGMRKFKSNDFIGQTASTMAVLCSMNTALMLQLEMADMVRAQDIIVFYSAG